MNGYEVGVHGAQRESSGLFVHRGKMLVKGGPVELPPASITTEMLVPDAAEAQIAAYAQLIDWTIGTANVWTETPVQVTLHFTGVRTRVEFNLLMSCPTKGQRIYYAIMLDGAMPVSGLALGALDAPENGYAMMAVGTYYVSPQVGTRRFAFGVYGPSGAKIHNVIPSTMYVTEQRR